MAGKNISQPVSNNVEHRDLLQNIGTAVNNGRQKAVNQVNQSIVETNWNIGRYIVEYEQAGHEKAEYGSETLKHLSHDLSERYGKGFGMSNVNKMRKLYLAFPILQTVSAKLSWSHYVELARGYKTNWHCYGCL